MTKNNEFDVIVSSFGGVGTSAFISWLGARKKCNSPADKDGLKHTVDPRSIAHRADRFVFIVGSPVLAIKSLFEREYVRTQMRKLTGKSHRISFSEYPDQGIDLVGFVNQFDNWNEFKEKPLLMLEYPHFWDCEQTILEFLQLPDSDRLFSKKPRSTSAEDISFELRQKYNSIYGELDAKIKGIDGCVIRNLSG